MSSGWGEEAVNRAIELDIVPDALNRPNTDFTGPINRMEFAGVAVRTYELLTGAQIAPASVMPFEDTSDFDVQKAYSAGIMIGYSDTLFEPFVQLNREQASTALTRVFKRYHFPGWTFETDANYSLSFAQPATFADDAFISDWAREGVYFMAANGIILGIGDNLFAPRNRTTQEEADGYATATREQALAIAVRMADNLGGGATQAAANRGGSGAAAPESVVYLRVSGSSLSAEDRYCYCGGYYVEDVNYCGECGDLHYFYECFECWSEEFGFFKVGYCCLCNRIGCIHWTI